MIMKLIPLAQAAVSKAVIIIAITTEALPNGLISMPKNELNSFWNASISRTARTQELLTRIKASANPLSTISRLDVPNKDLVAASLSLKREKATVSET